MMVKTVDNKDNYKRIQKPYSGKYGSRLTHYIILSIYIVLMAVISYFHEPWYDEAQAWVIARDASYVKILLKLPHVEGHPSLWWLWLSLFAKTGVPYLIGLKAASIIPMGIGMWFFLRKTSFPWYVKAFVPFNFFLFYQNGVISRGYSICFMGFMILATLWNKKEKKPIKTVLTMCLICATSAYGLILMFGLTLVWIYEIIKKSGKTGDFLNLIKKYIPAFLILFLFACFVAVRLVPVKDVALQTSGAHNPFLIKLIYMLFVAIPDCVYTSVVTDDKSIDSVNLLNSGFFFMVVIGIVLFALLFRINKYKKNFFELCIPFIIMSIFASVVYFYAHHLVIVASFILFWLSICEERAKIIKRNKYIIIRNNPGVRNKNIGKRAYNKDFNNELDLTFLVYLAMFLALFIPVTWTLYSGFLEINSNYSSGVKLSSYIRANNLQDATVLYAPVKADDTKIEHGEYKISSTNLPVLSALLPYMKGLYKFYDGETFILYSPNRYISVRDVEKLYSDWENRGYPDIIIGECDYKSMIQSGVQKDVKKLSDSPEYVCVQVLKAAKIYKYYQEYPTVAAAKKVYVKKEVAEKKHLKIIDWTKVE